MPIDPNIALTVKPIEIADPLAQYGKVAAIQSAQNQNALAQFQLSAAQRAEEDQQTIRNAMAGVKYGTPEYEAAITGAYAKTGNLKGLQDYQKAKVEQDKLSAEAALKKQELHRANLGNLAMNPSNENILAHLQDGVIKGEITQDQALAQWQQLGPMNAQQRVKFFNNAAMTADQRVGHEVTMRGQNLVDARARERLAQEAQAVSIQTDANGNLVAIPTHVAPGTVAKASAITAPGAGMEPLKAKDASKTAVSEQQASYNIGRVLNDAKEINSIVSKNPDVIKPGSGEALASAAGMSGTANKIRSADRQIVYGAQRDALDALLYLATGAAYNKEQLEGQMAAYIPSWSDEPATVQAKQTRMAGLIQTAKARAGKAWTPEMESAMQSLIKPGAAATGVDTSNPLLK